MNSFTEVLRTQDFAGLAVTTPYNHDFWNISYSNSLLLRYVLNPWSAFFVGYNSNASNFDLVDTEDGCFWPLRSCQGASAVW